MSPVAGGAKTAAAIERNQRSSREAKRRRKGVCRQCGGPTSYAGKRGKSVSDMCFVCNNRRIAAARRATGSRGAKIMERLASGPATYTELRKLAGLEGRPVGPLFIRLMRYGMIARVKRGVYALPEHREEPT